MTAASGRAVANSTAATVDWAPLLKDAVIAAVVATLLALPLVGVETYDVGGGALGIRTHFDRVAIAAAAVFLGRLALQIRQHLPRRGESRIETVLARLTAWGNRQALRLTIARCTSTAQRTASTTLENSTSMPSPVVLTMRPRCSVTFGWRNDARSSLSVRSVPSSSAPISRL